MGVNKMIGMGSLGSLKKELNEKLKQLGIEESTADKVALDASTLNYPSNRMWTAIGKYGLSGLALIPSYFFYMNKSFEDLAVGAICLMGSAISYMLHSSGRKDLYNALKESPNLEEILPSLIRERVVADRKLIKKLKREYPTLEARI